jgi:lysozyme
MTPATLAELRAQLARDEGRRNRPYTDSVGKLTIGIGHNLTDNGLSDAAVDFVFDEDLAIVFVELDQYLPWWREMDEPRQAVLTNMCFNMGIKVLLTFEHTLAAMQRGDYQAAADEMANSKWAEQVGPRATRLITMMRT